MSQYNLYPRPNIARTALPDTEKVTVTEYTITGSYMTIEKNARVITTDYLLSVLRAKKNHQYRNNSRFVIREQDSYSRVYVQYSVWVNGYENKHEWLIEPYYPVDFFLRPYR